jgi:hypothetical protein
MSDAMYLPLICPREGSIHESPMCHSLASDTAPSKSVELNRIYQGLAGREKTKTVDRKRLVLKVVSKAEPGEGVLQFPDPGRGEEPRTRSPIVSLRVQSANSAGLTVGNVCVTFPCA